MKNKVHIIFIPFVFMLFFGWGCKETINLCPSDQVPYLNCNFTYSDDFYADTFVVTLLDLDTVLYASKSVPSSLSIPLQFDKQNTEFQIFYHKDTVDLFTVKHTPNVVFESPDCGFVISFNLDSVIPYTTQKIDSVYILNPIIDQEEYENIEIAF